MCRQDAREPDASLTTYGLPLFMLTMQGRNKTTGSTAAGNHLPRTVVLWLGWSHGDLKLPLLFHRVVSCSCCSTYIVETSHVCMFAIFAVDVLTFNLTSISVYMYLIIVSKCSVRTEAVVESGQQPVALKLANQKRIFAASRTYRSLCA